MKSLQSANVRFTLLAKLAPRAHSRRWITSLRTDDELISPLRAYRGWFSAAETRRFGSEFRRCQFRKTVSAQCTSMCFPISLLPAPEIESAQPITTTVVSRCLCLHLADWRTNFPDCRRDDKPIPWWTNCAPVGSGRQFNMIRYVTGDSNDNL